MEIAQEYLICASFFCVFTYSMVLYPFAFNYEIYEFGYYDLSLATISTVLTSCIFSFFYKGTNGVYTQLAVLLASLVHVLYMRDGNEYASVVTVFLIYFLLLKTVLLEKLITLMYCISVLYLFQLIYAGYAFTSKTSSELDGTLHNTGVFSIFCIIFIPLYQYIIHKHLSGTAHKLLYVYVVPVIAIVFYLKSRTAVIAISLIYVIPFIYIYLKKKSQYSKYLLALGGCLLLTCTFFFLFYLKSGSSFGRILMLKIAVLHMYENFWFGTGLGKFTFYYPFWQADYFKNNLNAEASSFFLSAGESYLIFNEFIQLLLTIGFFPFVFIAFFSFAFFFRKWSIEIELFSMIKRTFAIILACSITYYTLHINVVLALIAFYSAMCSSSLPSTKLPSINITAIRGLKATAIIISLILLLYTLKKYDAIYTWKQVKQGYESEIAGSNADSNEIYLNLRNDGKFLADYGNFLYENGASIPQAINFMEMSKKKFVSKQSIENLAYLYLEAKDYGKAIASFEWLVNYVPNGFRNRLELLKLYIRVSEIEKAKHLARFSLDMPVKIRSKEVMLLRNEILDINYQLNNQ